MHFGLINMIKRNKLLGKLLAIASVFILSSASVEAVSHKQSVLRQRQARQAELKRRAEILRKAQTRKTPVKVIPAKKAPVKVLPAKKAPALKVQNLPPKQAAARERQLKAASLLRQRQARQAELNRRAEILRKARARKTPVKAAPVKVAPVKAAPVKAAPVKVAPVKAAPVKAAPVKVAPVKAAPVKVAPVKAAPVPKVQNLPPKQAAAARQAKVLRQQQAVAARQAKVLRQQQAAAARQAEALRQQQAAARQAEALRQQQTAALIAEKRRIADLRDQRVNPAIHNALLRTPFQNLVQAVEADDPARRIPASPYFEFAKFQVGRAFVDPDAIPDTYPTIDVGYTPALATADEPNAPLRSTGRSRIYDINIPNAPSIHLYHPANGNFLGDYQSPSYLINIKAAYTRDFAPPAIHWELGDVQDNNIEAYVMALYLPQLAPGSPKYLIRPQYWLEPDAPHQFGVRGSRNKNDRYSHGYDVKIGIVSSQPGGPRLKNQPENDLLHAGVSIHNSHAKDIPATADAPEVIGQITDETLISSPPNLDIENLDRDTRVFYSVTKWKNPATNIMKAAIVRYISLNEADRVIVERLIPAANNLQDLKDDLGRAALSKPVGRYFDPYERD